MVIDCSDINGVKAELKSDMSEVKEEIRGLGGRLDRVLENFLAVKS